MLATSTHDNKRSEDVRARIDVLSEMPEEWRALLRRWTRMNRSKKTAVDGEPAPSANDEYLLYQILLGTFMPESMEPASMTAYSERIVQYMIKAVREAKVHTSWTGPNEQYETALTRFINALLEPKPRNLFLKDLCTRARTLAWFGMLNSLSMTLIKLSSPGVPDIYQGNETADLSLVDPDNRRPVDYAARERQLERLETLNNSPRLPAEVRRLASEGLASGIKTWLVWRALELRSREPDIFRHGAYVPLQARGARSEHVVAFMRRHRRRASIAIAGRLWLRLGATENELPLGSAVWGDTNIDAGPLSGKLTNVVTGETIEVRQGRKRLADAFKSFPGALLVG